MPAVRRLKSRSEAFWRDEYRVSEPDLDLVTSQILDSGKPQPLGTGVQTCALPIYLPAAQ